MNPNRNRRGLPQSDTRRKFAALTLAKVNHERRLHQIGIVKLFVMQRSQNSCSVSPSKWMRLFSALRRTSRASMNSPQLQHVKPINSASQSRQHTPPPSIVEFIVVDK